MFVNHPFECCPPKEQIREGHTSPTLRNSTQGHGVSCPSTRKGAVQPTNRAATTLTGCTREPSAVHFDRYKVAENEFLVSNGGLVTVLKRVLQIHFRIRVHVLKQIETSRIVPIGHQVPHAALGMQTTAFHRSYQILTKPQRVQGKVNGKEFVDNKKDTNLFGSLGIVQGLSHMQLFAIIKCSTKGLL